MGICRENLIAVSSCFRTLHSYLCIIIICWRVYGTGYINSVNIYEQGGGVIWGMGMLCVNVDVK